MPCDGYDAVCEWHAAEAENEFPVARTQRSYISSLRNVGVNRDTPSAFLREVDVTPTPAIVKLVRQLCDDDSSLGSPIWIDDRALDVRGEVQHAEVLNPVPLSRLNDVLSTLSSRTTRAPDVINRRLLLHQWDPKGQDLLALLENVPFDHHPPVRELLCDYVRRQTSMGATFSDKSGANQLSFSFPTFELCEGLYDSKHTSAIKHGIPSLRCVEHNQASYYVAQHHKSFVATGSDESCWFAYCFDSHQYDPEDSDEANFQYAANERGVIPFYEDPIMNRNGDEDGSDASRPIWDERLYFLRCLDSQLARHVETLTDICDKTEISSESHRRFIRERCHLSRQEPLEELQAASTLLETDFPDWIEDTSELLRTFVRELQDMDAKWVQFSSPCKGMRFFKCITERPRLVGWKHLQVIGDKFEKLQDLQKRFDRCIESNNDLHQWIRDSLTVLKTRLSQDTNRLASDRKRLAEETYQNTERARVSGAFMTNVVMPVATIFAFFSMQPAAIPFTINFKNYLICSVSIFALYGIAFDVVKRPRWWQQRLVKIMHTASGFLPFRVPNIRNFIRSSARRIIRKSEETLAMHELEAQVPPADHAQTAEPAPHSSADMADRADTT